MALSFEEVNVLGNLINDTFGKYSTRGEYNSAEDDGDLSLGGYSPKSDNSVVCKASLQGEQLCVTSIAVVNLGPISHQHQVINDNEKELNQHINAFMRDLKKDFKKKENAGRALKVKEQKDKSTTDVQDINFYSERRQAYIYRRAYFEIN